MTTQVDYSIQRNKMTFLTWMQETVEDNELKYNNRIILQISNRKLFPSYKESWKCSPQINEHEINCAIKPQLNYVTV